MQRCSCCLHANAAAELEDVGEEGKRPEHAPTNTHTRTITTCHFTPFLVENQNRLDVLMCCCLAAENQEDQTHKHRLIKALSAIVGLVLQVSCRLENCVFAACRSRLGGSTLQTFFLGIFDREGRLGHFNYLQKNQKTNQKFTSRRFTLCLIFVYNT